MSGPTPTAAGGRREQSGTLERPQNSTPASKYRQHPQLELFAKVPEWLRYSTVPSETPGQKPRPLSSNAIRLYAVLQRHAGASGTCYPSCRSLAESMSCSVRTVDRCLRDLQAVNAVEVRPRFERAGSRERTSSLSILRSKESTKVSVGSDTGGATGSDRDVAKVATQLADKRKPVNECQPEREPLKASGDLTEKERARLAQYQKPAELVKQAPGMERIPAIEIMRHLRENNDILQEPLASDELRQEFRSFRDRHTEKRRRTGIRNWKCAINNWFNNVGRASVGTHQGN